MSDEAAFLAALKANPADDTTRLVYADWLDEHDESTKARYVRAVVDLTRLAGGTAEYNDAAVQLYTACPQTHAVWRQEAGGRFDVVLDGYDPAFKIHTIKIIREQTGFGLAEAKALAESVPTPLFSWLPFEQALPHLLAFDVHGREPFVGKFAVAIRPTAWPDGAPGAVFDIHLCSSDFGPWNGYAITGLAHLLNIAATEARKRLDNPPVVVGSGIPPAAVAEFVRRLKLICNVGRAMPADAISVIPRLPTQ